MPLLRIVTSAAPEPASRATLLAELSRQVATLLGKPEAYVMTLLLPDTAMTFAGSAAPACFVELKSIGTFTPEQTQALSSALCARLEAALGVSKSRIYIEFSDSKGYLWGHDGETFA